MNKTPRELADEITDDLLECADWAYDRDKYQKAKSKIAKTQPLLEHLFECVEALRHKEQEREIGHIKL